MLQPRGNQGKGPSDWPLTLKDPAQYFQYSRSFPNRMDT